MIWPYYAKIHPALLTIPARPFLPDSTVWTTDYCSHDSQVLVLPETLGWSNWIGYTLHAVYTGPTGGHTIISGCYNKCHSLQLRIYYTHFLPLQHLLALTTVQNGCSHNCVEWSWEIIMGFKTLHAGHGRIDPVWWVNILAPGRCGVDFKSITSLKFISWIDNLSNEDATEPHWWKVNIDSGNGLVPSGNKPLPEPMLTKIYDGIWHH